MDGIKILYIECSITTRTSVYINTKLIGINSNRTTLITMKKNGPKELACKFSCLFATIAFILTIIMMTLSFTLNQSFDVINTFCAVFWVFTGLCFCISATAPEKIKSKKIYPIEIV